MVWTQFMDMHSGGGTKTDYEYIYIEAPKEQAINVFGHMFDEHPYSVACSCCGINFSVHEYETLEDATHYERGRGTQSVADHLKSEDIKVVYASEINSEHVLYKPVDEYSAYDDYEDENE